MYAPTDRPCATSSAVAMRATDVLPLVPVRWTTGTRAGATRGGASRASMRSSVGCAARRGTPTGSPTRLEVHMRVEPAARVDEIGHDEGWVLRHPRGRDRPRPRARCPCRARSSPHAPSSRTSSSADRSASRRSGVSRTTTRETSVRSERSARGLRLAHRAEDVRRDLEHLGCAVGSGGADGRRRRARPHGAPSRRCHHDHTSSVTNGRCGANRRRSARRAKRQRGTPPSERRLHPGAVGALLRRARRSRRRSDQKNRSVRSSARA